MKYKKLSLIFLAIASLVIITACGNTEERAGAKTIAEKNKASIEKITTNLEQYENLEEEMMTALHNDLDNKKAVDLITKQKGEVGENFEARQKAIANVEKQMQQIKKNHKTLITYQKKKAVDMPETELKQAIQTLTQLTTTYDLFYTYYQESEKTESDFYANYTKKISEDDLTADISEINRTHGAAYQQLEVLYADLSSAEVAMSNLAAAISSKNE